MSAIFRSASPCTKTSPCSKTSAFLPRCAGCPPHEWKPRCLELLEFVGLSEFSSRRAGALSGGMKQKLGLASALVTRPQVLLLDEPTTGVDPVTRQDFWQLIIRVVHE